MKILVLNAGSSSIKYKLFNMDGPTVIAAGRVERIGEEQGAVRHAVPGRQAVRAERPIPAHRDGLEEVVRLLLDRETGVIERPDDVAAVGHRVVHGGERFSEPAVIDAAVLAAVRELIPLAPLHNPANLAGIEVASELFPEAVQVAVFDTAFHQTLPPHAYRYALPNELYEEDGIRVYGFHGTSHQYVAREAARHLGLTTEHGNLITLHLGNGASITAVAGGRSVDTSMGFSPLPGLVMGTRSGDVDPAVVFHLARERGMSVDEIDALLNKRSGLLGLCGENDLRDIEARMDAGDAAARLAFEVYVYRIRKYIGAYTAVLGRVDALVFTAGVGENSAAVRAAVCAGLEGLGYRLDPEKNAAGRTGSVTEIHAPGSAAGILIVATDEELEIAVETAGLAA
ncbi:MAG TPA: acetate kinase [Anaerolineales bacterium]|nr:acetate kinase [Anaerolineales bacterium]